jgi:ABC-type multidrug transport system ATPase subunit
MSEPVVDIQKVVKRFAGHTAVRDVSLRVPRGVVYGLLGPNGAGKTTTIRMLLNIIAPDEGRITSSASRIALGARTESGTRRRARSVPKMQVRRFGGSWR